MSSKLTDPAIVQLSSMPLDSLIYMVDPATPSESNKMTVEDFLAMYGLGYAIGTLELDSPVAETPTPFGDGDTADIPESVAVAYYTKTDSSDMNLFSPVVSGGPAGRRFRFVNQTATSFSLTCTSAANSFFNGTAGLTSSLTVAAGEVIELQSIFFSGVRRWFVTGRYSAPGGGAGDVTGPASATDNAVARYDSTTGKLIQNSPVLVGDTGNVSGVANLTTTGIETSTGANVQVPTVVSGAAVNIDFTKGLTTQSLTGNTTLTFTGSPAAHQSTIYEPTADSTPRVVTLPANVFMPGQSVALASFTVPASSKLSIQLTYDGANYLIFGVPSATGEWLSTAQAEISVTGATTLTIGRWHRCTGTASDYTVTLPAASGAANGFVAVIMSGALTKIVTVDGNGSDTIDGQTNLVMRANETAVFKSDGVSNWTRVAGKLIALTASMYRASAQNIPDQASTQILLDTVLTDDSGAMADIANSRINIIRAGKYSVIGQAMFQNLSGNSTNTQTRLFVNGALIANCSYFGIAAGYPTISVPFNISLNAGDHVTVDAYHNVGTTQALYVVSPTNQLCLTEQI